MPKISRSIFLGLLFLSCLIIFASIIQGTRFFEDQDNIVVTVFDVGQGDSILIRYQGQVILVDGGPEENFPALLGHELPFFENHIDYLILSHPQRDHFGGLISLPRYYSIGALLVSPLLGQVESYKLFQKNIKKENIPLIPALDIKEILFGEAGKIKILSPTEKSTIEDETNLNNASVVFQLSFGEMDMLFTGDIEEKMEKNLVEIYGDHLESEILKVPHHGSNSSSSLKFLQTVDPDIAFISSGKNNAYGHPRAIVLRRLEKLGSKIFRTDENGTMRFIIKKNGFCWKKGFFSNSCQFYKTVL